MSWSWTAFILGNMSGAVVTFLILGVMHIGALNDEVKPSVPEKQKKRRNAR